MRRDSTLNYQAFDTHFSLKQQLTKSAEFYRLSIPSKVVRVFVIISVLMFIFFPTAGSIVGLVGALINGNVETAIVMLFLSILAWAVVIMIIVSFVRIGKKRLITEQFCQDNGFTFTPFMNVVQEKGALFNKGNSRLASNGMSGTMNGNGFIMFDYQYTTGSGKNRSTHYFKVAKIRLAQKFPHILLDNRKDSSLGAFEFNRSQMLSLEGGFNKYFSVYGPKEYEIEVLQILNPKVMQTLLDMREPVDIEILNEFIYIYDKEGHRMTKETLEALFYAVETIIQSTESTQKHFSMSEQIGDNKPILKKSIWPAVFIAIWLLLSLIGPLAELFFD